MSPREWCNVLTVKTGGATDMYKRVIVPLDGSPVAEAILPFIVEIARRLDMEVLLLRVVESPPAPPLERGIYVPAGDTRTSLEKAAAAYLQAIARDLQARAVRVESVVRHGSPACEILAGAANEAVDLIAMRTHGRSSLGRLLFGSVAEAVLRRADVPVLLMRLADAPATAEVRRPVLI